MGFIRLLLAIAVILSHAGELRYIRQTVGGLIAVESFFILSGFYMALVLCKKYDNIAEFYQNRLSRIFSGYWVALFVAVIVAWMAGVNQFGNIVKSDWDWTSKALILFANLLLFGSDIMMFFYPSPTGLAFTPNFQLNPPQLYAYHYLSPAWSLPVELAFYAIAPFVVKSVPKLVAIAVASLICRYATYWSFGEIDPWTYRFLPSEMMFFMLGAITYHASVVVRDLKLPPWTGQCAFWFLIILIISYRPIFGWADQPFWHPSVFYLIFVFCLPPIFIHGTFNQPFLAGLDRWAGEVSYMVYLTHIIVLSNLQVLTGIRAHSLIVITITVAISALLHLIADKIDRWMRSIARRPDAVKLHQGI